MKLFDFLSEMEFYVFFFFAIMAAFFIRSLNVNLNTQDLGQVSQNVWLLLPDYAVAFMVRLFSFSFILSLILVVVIIRWANGLMRIRRQMHEALILPNQKAVKENDSAPEIVNEKWQKVLVHINSENPSDWKLAI